MANHPSAVKRHKQSLKRNERNRSDRSKLSTQIKKARLEIASNTINTCIGEVRSAVALLARSARKGLVHKKNAARRISRLMKQVSACVVKKAA